MSTGISMLDGRPYRFVTVALSNSNFSQVSLAGVNFTFNYVVQGLCVIVIGEVGTCYGAINSTSVNIYCPSNPPAGQNYSLCSSLLPQIKVSYPDGYYEYFNRVTVSHDAETQSGLVNGNKTTFSLHETIWNYDKPTSYPWFSRHTNPQVAIMLNRNVTDSLTLYVSV
jgi:hypothetical protein